MCIEQTSYYLNLVGLSLDFIGVIGLFIYGIPPEVSKDGQMFFVFEQSDQNEAKKYIKYRIRSKIAIIVVGLGFILQILSAIMRH